MKNVSKITTALLASVFSFGVAKAALLSDLEGLGSTVQCTNYNIYSRHFVPATGRVSAYELNDPNYPGGKTRNLWVDMWWPDNSRLHWFLGNADSTLEMDTIFNNEDGQAWAKSFSNAVFSNMPYYYVDTRDLDFITSPDQKNITIGSAFAGFLTKNKVYYYGGRMETDYHPNSLDPSSKIWHRAQRGRRVESLCFLGMAYCVFSCTQKNNFEVVPPLSNPPNYPSTLIAPGCKKYNWRYPNLYGNNNKYTTNC